MMNNFFKTSYIVINKDKSKMKIHFDDKYIISDGLIIDNECSEIDIRTKNFIYASTLPINSINGSHYDKYDYHDDYNINGIYNTIKPQYDHIFNVAKIKVYYESDKVVIIFSDPFYVIHEKFFYKFDILTIKCENIIFKDSGENQRFDSDSESESIADKKTEGYKHIYKSTVSDSKSEFELEFVKKSDINSMSESPKRQYMTVSDSEYESEPESKSDLKLSKKNIYRNPSLNLNLNPNLSLNLNPNPNLNQ